VAILVAGTGLASDQGKGSQMSTPYNVSGTLNVEGGTLQVSGTLNLTPAGATSPGGTTITPEPLPSQTAIGTGSNAQAWASAILTKLGAPVNAVNVSSLVGWFGQEDNHGSAGENADGIGANNPLSITADTPGITGSNGSVASGASGPPNLTFPTVAAGVNAIAEALASYPAILAALQAGTGLPTVGPANASVTEELSEWSGGGYNSV
jgi:hypothetical protein